MHLNENYTKPPCLGYIRLFWGNGNVFLWEKLVKTCFSGKFAKWVTWGGPCALIVC